MRRKIVGFLAIFATVFIMLCLCKSAKAQAVAFELTWRSGQVALASGDTITGIVTLTHPTDIIRVAQPDGGISTFSAVNVHSFKVSRPEQTRYYTRRSRESSTLDTDRTYVQLMWNHDKDYSTFKSPAFFNVVETGKYTLLRREILDRMYEQGMGMYGPGTRYLTETIVDKFYLLTPEGKILPLRNPKKDLPAAIPKLEKQLATYTRENRVRYTEPIDLARMVQFINANLP